MKLSAYHRARGDTVEWHDGRKYYDLVYMSRVFTDTYSKDDTKTVHADKIIRGGTGYGLDNKLPDVVEHACPDYRLYPQFAGTAYGFLSRGCPRGCGFCIVGKKEGRKSVAVADLSEFWRGENVMIYEKSTAPQETRKLQRWVNNKRIFWSVRDFEAYDPKYGGGEKR